MEYEVICGCIPTIENKLFWNYTVVITFAPLMRHCESCSDIFFFHKVSVPTEKPNHMRCYSLYTTGHIMVHITDFKFYIHKNI